MSTLPVQCPCGQILHLTRDAQTKGVRCPECGTLVRGGLSRRAHEADLPVEEFNDDSDDSTGSYGFAPVADEHQPAAPLPRHVEATWVPAQGREATPAPSSTRRLVTAVHTLGELRQQQATAIELPGRFFSWSALAYPLLYPTCVRWLGLSVMTALASSVISITIFVAWIVIGFHVFLAVFSIASMSMVCLALASYVVACFVEVIEETSIGEDRLQQLVDLSWWEMLPRFFRVASTAAICATLSWALCYPLRFWFPADSTPVVLLQAILAFQIFPILLITNLVDDSMFPIRSLGGTLRRLAHRAGTFAAFLLITAPVTYAAISAIGHLHDWHVAAGLVGSGPIGAAWILFYGHWLGRLVRQLADAE